MMKFDSIPLDDTGYLPRLNFVRIVIVLMIAFGYASTMPVGPGNMEPLSHLGYEPSWLGVQILFFLSGYLALASLRRRKSSISYLVSKARRNLPLLLAFTLASVIVIYPLFGVKSGNPLETAKKLLHYTFDTVSCLDPGRPLPGLLDDAKYMCLIQGAVWTFRYGALAHIFAAIGWKLNLFSKRNMIGLYAVFATIGYFTLSYYAAINGKLDFEAPLVGLRLGYPFLIGMTVYAYRDSLPVSRLAKLLTLTAFLALALIQYNNMPWTPGIELCLTAFWGYAALLLIQSKFTMFNWTENYPHLALGIYLANWPVSQLILLHKPGLQPLDLIALSLPITFIIAWISYVALTRPLGLDWNLRSKVAA